ncbi:MAG: hypothetical protein H6831_01375 [Planctomycetes bacterium]|nr:hypothetical protein [Planctomycetota bacterium]MCB9903037.1 hypothetical protein [Planctomycetota bacterium]
MSPRKLLRFCLASLLVVIPASYLLYEWSHASDPIAKGLSYESVNDQLTSGKDPAYWTYAIWVLCIFAVLTVAVKLVDWLLLKAFPNRPPER